MDLGIGLVFCRVSLLVLWVLPGFLFPVFAVIIINGWSGYIVVSGTFLSRACVYLSGKYFLGCALLLLLILMLDISLRLTIGLVEHLEEVSFFLVMVVLFGISGLMPTLSV